MRYLNKPTVFFVFMLFGYGVDIFAYKYKIANLTGGDVQIQLCAVYRGQDKTIGASFIKSGSSQKFVSSYCLSRIMVSAKTSGNQEEAHVKDRYGKSISISTGAGECASRVFILKRVSGGIVATML